MWKVFTNPEHIKTWRGPNGFTNTINTMEVMPGGVWELVLHGPDGTDYKNKSIYKEVLKPERIVFVHISPKCTATITFEADSNKTLLTWRMLFETAEAFQHVKDL